MVKTDGGFIVHYDDSSIEHKLHMMRIKSESSNDSTLSSTDLDMMDHANKENIRVKGDEEVEIDCDGMVLCMKEMNEDRLNILRRKLIPNSLTHFIL